MGFYKDATLNKASATTSTALCYFGPYVNTIRKFYPIKSNLQTHLLPIKERKNTCFVQPSPHFKMCFLFFLSFCLEKRLCNVAWIWMSERAASSSSAGGEKKERSRGGLTQESGVFWNQSSKELPAAYINHPQLAQRGNSICRELRCILFIEELLVIGHILHLAQRARRHGRRPQCASPTKKQDRTPLPTSEKKKTS